MTESEAERTKARLAEVQALHTPWTNPISETWCRECTRPYPCHNPSIGDAMSTASCHYCSTTERDLRPYGPGGSWVCFPCAMETPEREKQAENAFGALFDGSEAISPTGIVAIGETGGPRPFDPNEVSS